MNTHAIEPELLQPAPRAIKRRRGMGFGNGCLQIFLLPHTFVGIGLALWALHSVIVAVFGTVAPAQITQVDSSRGSKGSVTYFVRYTYSLGGQTYESKSNLSKGAWSALRVGGQLQVKALPFTPDHNTIPIVPGGAGYWQALLTVPFALFWNGILSLFYFIMYGPALLSRKLVKNGVPVVAEIQNKQSFSSKGTSYFVEYAYLPSNADPLAMGNTAGIEPFTATNGRMRVNKDIYDRLNKGDWTTVLYDAKKPSRSILYLAASHDAV